MDKPQRDPGSPVTTTPANVELEQRILVLEKEIADSRKDAEKLRRSDLLLAERLR